MKSSKNFREAVSLQRKYGLGRKIMNTLQTNAALLTDEMCEFFRDNSFLLGVSIDGSEDSVKPEQWGNFLCEVLRMWLKYDAGHKHVQLIDAALENMRRIPCSLCVHNPLCGHSGSVEANGDVYSCDRYAFPSHYLENLLDTDLKILMDMNRDFGMLKTYGLPEECLDCAHVKLCFGGCPVHRLNAGKNYLCGGYMQFFSELRRLIKV